MSRGIRFDFRHDRKGMEMWQLVMIILALLLLFFVLAWYGGLANQIKELLDKLGSLL